MSTQPPQFQGPQNPPKLPSQLKSKPKSSPTGQKRQHIIAQAVIFCTSAVALFIPLFSRSQQPDLALLISAANQSAPSYPSQSAPRMYMVANKACDNRALLRGVGFPRDVQLDLFYTYQKLFTSGPMPQLPDSSQFIREAQFMIYDDNGFAVLVDPLARPEMSGFPEIYYVAEMPVRPGFRTTPIALSQGTPMPSVAPTVQRLLAPGQATETPEPPLPTILPSATISPGMWQTHYYQNRELITDSQISRVIYDIWFPDGLNYLPSNALLNQGNYSARFERTEVITVPYNMEMVLTVDDGARFFVDDQLVIDEWHAGPVRTRFETVPLIAGAHKFRLEHFEDGGASTLCFAWRPDYEFWTGRYYRNTHVEAEPLMIRDDQSINFNWQNKVPHPLLDPLNYSVKWERDYDFSEGEYEFAVKTSGGVRVFIDNMPIPGMDHWDVINPERVVQTCWVKAGRRHITVDYRNPVEAAQIKFTFQRRVLQKRPFESRPVTCP